MSLNLNTIYRLPRASVYTNPLDENAKLPIPYGDLTDGSSGNWVCPCIDTVNFVYAVAGCAILSVGNGNVINVYGDDEIIAGANYTFDESNNYESQGNIATLTFTGDQENKIITIRGKGRDDGAGNLLTNAIDQIYDFIVTLNGFSSTEFDDTTRITTYNRFEAQSYVAAGVINNDITYWSLLQRILSSFWGKAFRSVDNKIVMLIDDGTLSQYTQMDRISSEDVEVIEATRKMSSIINRCPIQYAYNYAKQYYRRETNADSHIDSLSQAHYGERLPTKGYYPLAWCRDRTSAQTIQTIIIERYKNPPWVITIEDKRLSMCFLEVEDIFSLTVDFIYDANGNRLTNQLWRALSVGMDIQNNSMIITAEDTNLFLTGLYLLDGAKLLDGSWKLGGDRDTNKY